MTLTVVFQWLMPKSYEELNIYEASLFQSTVDFILKHPSSVDSCATVVPPASAGEKPSSLADINSITTQNLLQVEESYHCRQPPSSPLTHPMEKKRTKTIKS
jgi:hypothetical protein